MNTKSKTKTVIITGGYGGMGYDFARELGFLFLFSCKQI